LWNLAASVAGWEIPNRERSAGPAQQNPFAHLVAQLWNRNSFEGADGQDQAAVLNRKNATDYNAMDVALHPLKVASPRGKEVVGTGDVDAEASAHIAGVILRETGQARRFRAGGTRPQSTGLEGPRDVRRRGPRRTADGR
jgi:hypothetical protein